jgi:ethanolamine utilization protein EutN
MQLARVIGTVVATRKNGLLRGAKLLLVQPVTPDGENCSSAILAIDSVGAGVGETVLVVLEGRAAGDALRQRGAPVDAAIIGIIDRLDVETAEAGPDTAGGAGHA